MRYIMARLILALTLAAAAHQALAAPAWSVPGKDRTFPNRIGGLPAKLTDFSDIEINFFRTSDGVRLSYWEAGHGKP